MAFCPRCQGEMGLADVVCRRCGYDFPVPPEPAPTDSPVVKISLFVGIIGAGLGCLFAVLVFLVGLFTGQFSKAFIVAPMLFSVFLAVLVVLLKAANRD